MDGTPKNLVIGQEDIPWDSRPVVIIGPNGSGKSTLGFNLAQENDIVERICARRDLQIPNAVSAANSIVLRNNFNNTAKASREKLQIQTTDINELLRFVISEEAEIGMKLKHGKATDSEKTVYDYLKNIWEDLFQDKRLDVDHFQLLVELPDGTTYSQDDLSDGERQGLYLISRIAAASAEVLVIDEPEVYLHEYLARRLWDLLESTFPNKRFVYLTHSIRFALSRSKPHLFICRDKGDLIRIESEDGVPDEVMHEILGAASMTVDAQSILFCEGKKGGFDERLFSRVLLRDGLRIVPVGGCGMVEKCTRAFRESPVISGLSVFGVVDRDVRTEEEIDFLRRIGVFTLELSEVESLLCTEVVFDAVSLDLIDGDIERQSRKERYLRDLESELKVQADRTAVRYTLASIRWKLEGLPGAKKVGVGDTADATLGMIQSAFDSTIQDVNPERIYNFILERIQDSLGQHLDAMLVFLKGKAALRVAANTLDVTKDEYTDCVIRILEEETPALKKFSLRQAIQDMSCIDLGAICDG